MKEIPIVCITSLFAAVFKSGRLESDATVLIAFNLKPQIYPLYDAGFVQVVKFYPLKS